MPDPTLLDLPPAPTAPTPQQAITYVTEAANKVIEELNEAAAGAQSTVQTSANSGVQAVNAAAAQMAKVAETAASDLRAKSELARGQLQDAGNGAVSEFRALAQHILSLLGQLPAPEDLAIGDVNGQPFYEPLSFFALFMGEITAKKRNITVRFKDPDVVSKFAEFAGNSADEVATRAREKLLARLPSLPVPASTMPSRAVDGGAGGAVAIITAMPAAVWIILAIAVLVLAVAASAFIVLMGLAVIYAIYKGYDITGIKLQHDTLLVGQKLELNFTNPSNNG